jgi:hypothetical protein
MKGYRLPMKLLGAAAVALMLAAPAAAAPRLTAADRASINRTLDVFVNHAVKRVDVGASYDTVAPEMRPGMSRKAWATGDIPVYPFPAGGRTFHGWNILYVTRHEVGLELELLPRPHAKVGPIIFHVYLRPVHGRWLVDSFMPVATLAPLDAKKAQVRSVRDYSPQPQGEGGGASGSPGRLGSIWLVVPFAAIGLGLVGLAGWGLAAKLRDRRLDAAPRRSSLPPLPGRVSGNRRA